MPNITATCDKCGKQFLIIEPEQAFLRQKDLPLPTKCPDCRQERRLELRGGRKLYKTACQKCGKEIVTSYDPQGVRNVILCKEDYERYLEENDNIITESLPDASQLTGTPKQPQEEPSKQSGEIFEDKNNDR